MSSIRSVAIEASCLNFVLKFSKSTLNFSIFPFFSCVEVRTLIRDVMHTDEEEANAYRPLIDCCTCFTRL